MYLYCWKKSVWVREKSKFRTFSKNLKTITSKCGLCFLGTVEAKVMDVPLKQAAVWLCARAQNLHLYSCSLSRVGSRRFWLSQREQGRSQWSPPLAERIILVLGWLHHFLTFCAAVYNSVSTLLSKNTVSPWDVCINTGITVLVFGWHAAETDSNSKHLDCVRFIYF